MGNFLSFYRKRLVTQVRVIYNNVGMDNFEFSILTDSVFLSLSNLNLNQDVCRLGVLGRFNREKTGKSS